MTSNPRFWKETFAHFSLCTGFLLLSAGLFSQHSEAAADSISQQIVRTKDPLQKSELYNELAQIYKYTSPSKAEEYAEQAKEIAIEAGIQEKEAQSRRTLGELSLLKQDYAQALENLAAAEQIYEQGAMTTPLWKVRREMGVVYYEMGEYPTALDFFLSVLKYYEKTEDPGGVATVLNNIGILFHRQSNPEKALEYYSRALNILGERRESGDDLFQKLQTNLGLSYLSLGEYKKAEKAFLVSLEAGERSQNLYYTTVNIGNLAATYAEQKEYEKGEEFFKLAIENSLRMGNNQSAAVNQADLGRLYLEMAEEAAPSEKARLTDRSIAYLQAALPELKKNKDYRRYQNFLKELSDAYAFKGDHRKALEVYREHSEFKDSVFNDEIRRELTRKEIGYEFSKREDSIRLQSEKEIAVRDATLKVNRRQKWLLLTGLILLGIIGTLLYNQSRVRKKNNLRLQNMNQELNKANQMKAKLFSILGHDFRMPISNIIKSLRLQQESDFTLDEPTKNRLGKQTLHSAENLLSVMDDLLLWSKGQMENFKPRFSEVPVKEVFDGFRPLLQPDLTTQVDFRNPENLILSTDRDFLYTIVRNLTFNALDAVKAVKNPQIIWKAYTSGQSKILSISDNGTGAEPEQFAVLFDHSKSIKANSGMGLHIVRDMSDAINARIEVDTLPEKGTLIKLIFDSSHL